MKSTIENLSSVERKIAVEVEPEQVQHQLDEAYRTLNRKVRVEGFRLGKTPRHVLERRYRSQVEQDVAELLIERSYGEVVTEQKLDVVSRPQVERPAFKVGEPLRYEVRVEVRPVITAKDYTGLPIKRGKHAVGDAEVDADLERIRNEQSTMVAVEGRDVAQKGDYALIDFQATIDGKPFTGNQGENVTVEVADGDFTQGFVGQIEGMKVGDERTVDYAFPADYRNSEAAGKQSNLALKLKELKSRKLPALDDELAKDLGAGNTLAELKDRVRKGLEKAARDERDAETRKAVLEGLVSRNPFECPKAMIDRGVNGMLEGMVRTFARQGIDLRELNLDLESLVKDARPRAEHEVRGSILLEAVANQEKVEVSDDDFDQRVAELAEANNVKLAKMQQTFRDPEQRATLKAQIRERKAIAFIESKGNVEET